MGATLYTRYSLWLIERERLPAGSNRAQAQHDMRGLDMLTEAMGRLARACTGLESVLRGWDPGFCPSFTCNEAELLRDAALGLLIDESVTDSFMVAHAWTDDEDNDDHRVSEHVPAGWVYTEHEDDDTTCSRCGEEYDEDRGDGYCGLCPKCADETEPAEDDDVTPMFELVGELTYNITTDSIDYHQGGLDGP